MLRWGILQVFSDSGSVICRRYLRFEFRSRQICREGECGFPQQVYDHLQTILNGRFFSAITTSHLVRTWLLIKSRKSLMVNVFSNILHYLLRAIIQFDVTCFLKDMFNFYFVTILSWEKTHCTAAKVRDRHWPQTDQLFRWSWGSNNALIKLLWPGSLFFYIYIYPFYLFFFLGFTFPLLPSAFHSSITFGILSLLIHCKYTNYFYSIT